MTDRELVSRIVSILALAAACIAFTFIVTANLVKWRWKCPVCGARLFTVGSQEPMRKVWKYCSTCDFACPVEEGK